MDSGQSPPDPDSPETSSSRQNFRRRILFSEECGVTGELVFRREGVLVRPRRGDTLIAGVLEVVETKAQGVFITWDRDTEDSEQSNGRVIINDQQGQVAMCVGSPPSADWAVIADQAPGAACVTPISRVRFSSRSDVGQSPAVKFASNLEEKQLKMVVEMSEIKSYKLADDGNMVTIMMKDGTVHNSLIFLDEGPEKFFSILRRYASVRKSQSDDNLFVLTDKKVAALDESLSELNLIDMMSQPSNSEYVWKTINDFHKDPYTTGFQVFSKMTKVLLSPHEETRPEDQMADLLQGESVGASLDVSQSVHDDGEKTDWQLVTNKSKTCIMASYRPAVREAPLCQLDWELHFTGDGVVTEVPELLDKVFRGGVEENIRPEVWKYLLGYHKWHHPAEVRETNRRARVEEYFRMKLQWKSMSEEQQNRFSGFRERLTQVEKDIGRTDRSQPFYSGEDNPNVALLQDILMTYVMYNFDLGYVQGMSDLLSPLLFIMKNEVDAFWCFVGFMDRVASNFDFDQGGMKRQLDNLGEILRYTDPVFYNYLASKESGNLYFCFRWLLIWFKREFEYSDTMRLWEVLWTKKPCKNFHLLFSAALLDTEKSSIVENKYGFTEILKHINDMSHRIDVEEAMAKAEGLFTALASDPEVNDKVVNILGLAPATPVVTTSGDVSSTEIPASTANNNLSATSNPVTIQRNRKHSSNSHHSSGHSKRERHITDSSNASSSMNNSSSVEVLSEMEDEQRFENSLSHGFY